jgi:hypothetical protein
MGKEEQGPMEDISVERALAAMERLQEEWAGYQEKLVLRANLQEATENMYDQLVELVREAITLLGRLTAYQVVPPPWIASRDEFIRRALCALPDD